MVEDVAVGGDAPVSIQSILIRHFSDVESTVRQINRLIEAGCGLSGCRS